MTKSPLVLRPAPAESESQTRKDSGDRDAVPSSDGDLKVDDDAVVSFSEDGGAYVMCWKWVYARNAGMKQKSKKRSSASRKGGGYERRQQWKEGTLSYEYWNC
jgi:hypothetical protein